MIHDTHPISEPLMRSCTVKGNVKILFDDTVDPLNKVKKDKDKDLCCAFRFSIYIYSQSESELFLS